MLEWIIKFWMYVTEMRLYTFSGDRNELNKIKEREVRIVGGRVIKFNFYEKTRIDHVIRFGIVREIHRTTYVIQAVFSDEFLDEMKEHNEIKYYLDFNTVKWFDKDLVLEVLLGNFATYLSYKFDNLNRKEM